MNNNKKGQVTIFIIIALLLVIVLVIIFWPRVKPIFTGQEFSPNAFFESCIKEDLENAIQKVSEQGGSINPILYITYKQNPVEYLCYTSESYKTCVMQKPLLKQSIEKEILDSISPKITECFENTKKESSRVGYQVSSQMGSPKVELSGGEVNVEIPADFVIEKGEERKTYEILKTSKKSSLYTFSVMTSTILQFEANYGDFDTLTFMFYYPDTKVEKHKIDEGDKVYVLTNKITNEQFTFATRSLAWPAGYFE